VNAPDPAPARTSRLTDVVPGLLLATVVVVAARLVAKALPGQLPATTVGVLLGLAAANAIPLGAAFKPGLDFCVKKLLRLGIVLVGIRLSLVDVLGAGGVAIPVVLALVTLALLAGPRLARLLGASPRLGILAGASTAICGITATLAVAPVIEAEDREVAYTVANVTLCGLVGMLFYPYVAHALLGAHEVPAGLFLGTAIHDTSQVTGAALCYRDAFGSEVAMKTAIVAKLVRNSALLAVVPLLGWMHARSAPGGGKKVSLAGLFPLFVLGFLGMAILRSAGDAGIAGGGHALGLYDKADWKRATDLVASVGTDGCLSLALASLGLTTRFAALRDLGARPLFLGVGTALLMAGAALGMALLAARFAG
jgi:uncharacterized integral membrane protein (TIGR00698 family)